MTTLPVTSPCRAPDSALYFRPDGIVAACCASWHVLGRVDGRPRESLHEIWHGARARTLRQAIAAHDWGFGCWECGTHIDAGARSQSLASAFDDVAQDPGSPYPRFMDFALSNLCNLQCVMCNGGLSSAIRRHREHRPALPAVYDDRFFSELEEFLPHLDRASFKGGEPFLASENRRIWDAMLRDGMECDVAVTTNGTLLTDRVAAYVRELRMAVNVSVDAVDHDLLRTIRVGVDPDALWRNIEAFRSITAEVGSNLTMSFCLMSSNWRELPRFLCEARRLEAHPHLIWVDGPERHAVFALPPAELRRAAAELRISAADPGLALGDDDRSTLVAVADRLDAGSTPAERTVGVELTRSPSSAVGGVGRSADPTGGLRLELRDGVIRSAQSPPWADWLLPDEWVGVGLEELMPTISARSGGSMRGTMSAMPGGVHRVLIDFPEQPDRPTLEAIYEPAEDGASTVTVYARGPADAA